MALKTFLILLINTVFLAVVASGNEIVLSGKSKDYCTVTPSMEQSSDQRPTWKVSYDFKEMEGRDNGLHITFAKPILIGPEVEAVSIMIFDTRSKHRLYFFCNDAASKSVLYSKAERDFRTLNHQGWESYSFSPATSQHAVWGDRQENNQQPVWPLRLQSLWLDPMNRQHLKGEIYLGNISLKYRDGRVEQILTGPKDATAEKKADEVKKNNPIMRVASKHYSNIAWDGEPSEMEFDLYLPDSAQKRYRQVIDILDRGGNLLQREVAETAANHQGKVIRKVLIPAAVKGYYQIRYRLYSGIKKCYEYQTSGAALESVKVDDKDKTFLGMGFWNWHADPHQVFPLLKKMGIFWIRTDALWPTIEKSPGKYDWKKTDRMFNGAAEEGMRLLATIQYVPQWAALAPYHQYGGNPRPDAWRSFLQVLSERYRDRISCYEVWNEPDTPYHWAGGVNAYLEHLKISCEVIRKYAPGTPIASGGITGTATSAAFMDDLFRLGAGKYFDICSYHYGQGQFGQTYQQQMKRHHVEGVRLWNTEDGFGAPDERILNTLSDLAEGVEKSFYFEYDSDSYDETGMFDRKTSSPRPVMPMYAMLSRQLNSTVNPRRLPSDCPVKGFALESRDGKKKIMVIKNNQLKQGIAVQFSPVDQITRYDATGLPCQLTPINGYVGIPIAETTYLEFPASSQILAYGQPILEMTPPAEMIAGRKNLVSVLLRNPSAQEIRGEIVVSGSSAWNRSRDQQAVTLAPGAAITLKFELEPDINSCGDSFRCDAILNSKGGTAAINNFTGQVVAPVKLAMIPEAKDGKAALRVSVGNLLNVPLELGLRVALPASWNSDAVRTLKLQAGGSETFTMPIAAPLLSGTNRNRSYLVTVEESFLGTSITKEHRLNWICIPELKSGFDWKSVPVEAVIDRKEFFIADSRILETWTGPDDLSVKFQWGWQPERLCFHWEVRDNIHHSNRQEEELWSGDSIQMWLDGCLYDLAMVDGKPRIFSRGVEAEAKRLELKVERKGGVTVYDLTVRGKYQSGDRFPFAFCVNDNDGEAVRKGWMYYLERIGSSSTRSKCPVVTLIK